MGRAKPDREELYLSYLDALDDEDRFFKDEETSPLDPNRIAYSELRKERPERDDGGEAERRFRNGLVARLHSRQRSALCFSGGGIRSATFGLGLLQGLAACSSRVEGSRAKLLGEFDYLSTVSGGGYLGAWFSSWAARLSKVNGTHVKDCAGPTRSDEMYRDGPALVIEQLAKNPDTGFDPEAVEVKHLRTYSNFLTPKVGLFTSDTWTLASIVVRNILLNWLVLLPLFALILLVPVLSWHLASIRPGQVGSATVLFLLGSGFLFGSWAAAYVGYDLPTAGNKRLPSKTFLRGCLLPLCFAAVQLTVFWAWLPPGGSSSAWWDVVGLGKQGLTWWHFGLFGALMHGGGLLAGARLAFKRHKNRLSTHRRPVTLCALAAAATGFGGGFVASSLTHLPILDVDGGLNSPRLYSILAFPCVIGAFVIAQTLLVGASSYLTDDEDREWWARSGGMLLAVAMAWLTAAFLVLYSAKGLDWLNVKFSAVFTAATGITGWAAARAGCSADTSATNPRSAANPAKFFPGGLLKEYGGRLLLPVFVILLALLLSAANLGLVDRIDRLQLLPSFWPGALRPMGDTTASALLLALAYAFLCALASYFININKFSLHGMYRLRLIRAYLGGSNVGRNPNLFTGFDESDNLPMCSLARHRPLHVVNMTLNLVHGSKLAWQQRKAEPFSSTRLHTGSCRVGYRSSGTYGGQYNKHQSKTPISLGTAITISGAAASPNMGYHSSPLLSLVMTLFNARLGWWLGNPRSARCTWQRPGPRWGIKPFIDEAFGLTDDSNDWLYLSDGGHFENLGIYEMVLRRCHLIVVSDAGADPNYSYEDLANAVRKIRVDLGIPIEMLKPAMPMSPARRMTTEFAGHHCAIGSIGYSAVDGSVQDGVLIYMKASLNGNETPDVQHYASMKKSFPQQPTSDQFYDESQFESYRRLGIHVIEEICGSAYHSSAGIDLASFENLARAYCKKKDPTSVDDAGPLPPEKAPGLKAKPKVDHRAKTQSA